MTESENHEEKKKIIREENNFFSKTNYFPYRESNPGRLGENQES